MPDLDLTAVAAVRRAIADQQDALRRTRIDLSAASSGASSAVAVGRAADAEAAEARMDDLDRQRVAQVAKARSLVGDLLRSTNDLIAAFPPEQAVESLSGVHPVLLLPIRIETRFFNAAQTLKVRIFPDQAHVTAHDPALTEDEVAGLTWYWTLRWPDQDSTTDGGRALAEQAWQGLTARFRPGRAAFLVRRYPPQNLGSADPTPTWPELPRRSGEWSVAARASLLPDRWCVLGFRADGEGRHTEIFRKWGSAVPDSLAVGPTPDPGAPAERNGLPDDPDLAWLHNPAEAAGVGMLITVVQSDLRAGAQLSAGVDRLIVVGVDWTLDPAAAAAAVETHLGALADEGRLAFVPQGVPTNATSGTRSAYSTDIRLAEAVLAPHAAVAPASGAAAPVVTAALGIPGASVAGAAGADLREQAWQGALLEATWSAIGGYFVSAMLDPIAAAPDIEASLRHHVTTYLRASGPLPTLRIGAQPYGILPVTPRKRFEPDLRRRAQADVAAVTETLRGVVQPLIDGVPRLAKVRRREDVDDLLLALLQRTPVAWSLTFRQLVGPIQRKAISPRWDLMAAYQQSVTAGLMVQLGVTGLPLFAELTHDDRDHPLNVPLVSKPDPS